MARLRQRAVAWPAVTLSLLAAWWLLAARGDERTLERANAAGLRGDFAAAVREARDAADNPTTASRANAVAAYALLRLRRPRRAAGAFRRALGSDPSDWRLRRDLAQTLALLGRRGAAARQMERALGLNPRMRLPGLFRAPAPDGRD